MSGHDGSVRTDCGVKKKATVNHRLSPGYLTQHQQRSAACLVQRTDNLNDEEKNSS